MTGWVKYHEDYFGMDDVIPLYGVRAIVGIDKNGEKVYAVTADGEIDPFHFCGYLDALKIELLKEYLHENIVITNRGHHPQ